MTKFKKKTVEQYEAEATREPNGCLIHPNKCIRARRVYKLRHGEIPKPLCVCHTCDNPWCIEDTHPWLGTNKEKSDDASKKGRMRKTLEFRKQVSKKLRGRKYLNKWRRAISKAKRGKPFSDKHRAALSMSKLGKPASRKHRGAIAAALLGHTVTKEARTAISEGHKIKREFFNLMLQRRRTDEN